MSDKKIILTVRATADGVYGNYLYKGPITSDEGYTPGEVFKVDATPYVMKDEHGKEMLALTEDGKKIPILDAKGKQKFDEEGKKLWKVRMATFFSPTWMERVADDSEITHPDRPAWQIPEAYKIRKPKAARVVPLPPELAEMAGLPVPDSVKQASEETPPIPEEVASVI